MAAKGGARTVGTKKKFGFTPTGGSGYTGAFKQSFGVPQGGVRAVSAIQAPSSLTAGGIDTNTVSNNTTQPVGQPVPQLKDEGTKADRRGLLTPEVIGLNNTGTQTQTTNHGPIDDNELIPGKPRDPRDDVDARNNTVTESVGPPVVPPVVPPVIPAPTGVETVENAMANLKPEERAYYDSMQLKNLAQTLGAPGNGWLPAYIFEGQIYSVTTNGDGRIIVYDQASGKWVPVNRSNNNSANAAAQAGFSLVREMNQNTPTPSDATRMHPGQLETPTFSRPFAIDPSVVGGLRGLVWDGKSFRNTAQSMSPIEFERVHKPKLMAAGWTFNGTQATPPVGFNYENWTWDGRQWIQQGGGGGGTVAAGNVGGSGA